MLAGGLEAPEDVARFLLDAGVKVVALKMGQKGCYVRSFTGEEIALPSLPVAAIDALGAGDAFAAGFIAGIVRGWDLEQCARFATAVGACCVTALGATTGILTFEETMAFLHSFGGANSSVGEMKPASCLRSRLA